MNAKRFWIFAAVGAVVAVAAYAQPYGMGPGMMGGFGGFGMGPGMMGNGPGFGMGRAMMWGGTNDGYAGLDLSADQRKQIAQIEEQTSQAMWQLMGSARSQGFPMQGPYGSGSQDEAQARQAFDAMTQTRQAMFEMRLEARKRIEAVLTDAQRAQLSRRP